MLLIGVFVDCFECCLSVLLDVGVVVDGLVFEGKYGCLLFEYYDGFVFGFDVDGCKDLLLLVMGGCYDVLICVLGQGCEVFVVGVVVCFELVVVLRGQL